MVRGGGGSDRRKTHEAQDEEGEREQRMVRNVLLYYPNLIGGCSITSDGRGGTAGFLRGSAGLCARGLWLLD